MFFQNIFWNRKLVINQNNKKEIVLSRDGAIYFMQQSWAVVSHDIVLV